MKKHLLVEYLDCRRLPLVQHEGAVELHNALCASAPQFYLRLLADPATDISHKREMFVHVLTDPFAHDIERQRIEDVLHAMPLAEALQLLTIIRDLRINRSRARELVLTFLIGHEQFPELAAIKRQRVGHLLKHVFGERTWSAIKRALANKTPEGELFLQREVLRYAWNGDGARACEVLCFLTGVPFNPIHTALVKSLAARQNLDSGAGLPAETLQGLRGIFHRKTPLRKIRQLSAPVPTTVHPDGPMAALYKNAFTNLASLSQAAIAEPEHVDGPFAGLRKALASLLEHGKTEAKEIPTVSLDASTILAEAVASLPLIDRSVAIVLDLSASMVSSGERLNHPAALALALTRLLQERVHQVSLHQVGGTMGLAADNLPVPQGVTDVATAIIAAARTDAQIILVITDGYENVRQGDAALVVNGLHQLGRTVPIYEVVPQFTAAENLGLRLLGENIPVIPVAHEDGVQELLARILLASESEDISDEELHTLQQLLTVR
jgi:hypothetical protein